MLLLFVLIVSACSEESPIPLPTEYVPWTPSATFVPADTPTGVVPATTTPTPLPSETPIPGVTPLTGRVSSDVGAFVRDGPGLHYHIAGEVAYDDVLTALAYTVNAPGDIWYLIQLRDGRRAWISAYALEMDASRLSPAATIPPTLTPIPATPTVTRTPFPPGANAIIEADGRVNLREGPDFAYARSALLAPDTLLNVIGRTEDSGWLEVTTLSGRSGWMRAEYIRMEDTRPVPVTWAELAPPPPAAGIDCGINLQPKHGHGWPSVHPDLSRAGWVRFPFVSSTIQFRTLDEAFAFYDPVIRAYNSLGVRVLLVLTHETYGEGRDWPAMTDADWEVFIPEFVEFVGRIAAHYGNRVAGYEIWNESNAQPNDPAAVHVPPRLYARLLDSTAQVIRESAPQARIILGGLLIGSEASYVREIRAALRGRLPVDAIGVHPYAFGAPDDQTPFSPLGDVDGIIKGLNEAAPGMPLWFTEVGAIGDNQPSQWSAAASYLRSLYRHLEGEPSRPVSVIIWYGWSDAMHPELNTNGLMTSNHQPKSPLFETFFEMCP